MKMVGRIIPAQPFDLSRPASLHDCANELCLLLPRCCTVVINLHEIVLESLQDNPKYYCSKLSLYIPHGN